MKAEINAIDKSKYIESQKAHRDLFFDEQGRPSQDFYDWWIKNHAKKFREAWDISICRKCQKINHCKDCLKNNCENFLLNPDTEPSPYRELKLFLYRLIIKIDKTIHPNAYL
jgi:hypothetical protein